MSDRARIAARMAQRLLDRQGPRADAPRGLVGMDGFIDEILKVVDTRHNESHYEPVRTIGDFAEKIRAAAGRSANYELVVQQIKLGGNGPIMAHALAQLDLNMTYLGNVGYPKVHPIFERLAERADILTVADPGHTQALEFEDGKLMWGKPQPLNDVTWLNLVSRVGVARLRQLFQESALVALVNWTMLVHMSEIWRGLLSEVLPFAPNSSGLFFVDLADPEKRTAEDLRDALGLITQFQQHRRVILGLNEKESEQVAHILDVAPGGIDLEALAERAGRLRSALGVYAIVVHPRHGAAVATAKDQLFFQGPYVLRPALSTGAGDHFNAGFALAQLLDATLAESLACGVATSGYYVRTGESPSRAALSEFLEELPEGEK